MSGYDYRHDEEFMGRYPIDEGGFRGFVEKNQERRDGEILQPQSGRRVPIFLHRERRACAVPGLSVKASLF